MTVGDRIKQRRLELQLSQDELAHRVGYTSRSTINKIEKDANHLRQNKIMAFAKALNTTPSYLMGWEDEPEEPDELLHKINMLAPADREIVESMVDRMLGAQEHIKKISNG